MSSSLAAQRKRRARAPRTSFTKARTFAPAETHAKSIAGDEDIRILPAKHGFVSLIDWPEPYDTRFGQDGSISDEELGRRAEPLAWSRGALVILGGVQDVRAARSVFAGAALSWDVIRAEANGAGVGCQIGWLAKEPQPPPLPTLTRGDFAALQPWSIAMRHVACADRAGVIRFTKRRPKSAPPICRHQEPATLRSTVSAVARLAYDNETLLVPGVPEAKSEDAALAAVAAFAKAIDARLAERAS